MREYPKDLYCQRNQSFFLKRGDLAETSRVRKRKIKLFVYYVLRLISLFINEITKTKQIWENIYFEIIIFQQCLLPIILKEKEELHNFIASNWISSNLKCSITGILSNILSIVSFVTSMHPYIDSLFRYLQPLRRYLRLLSLELSFYFRHFILSLRIQNFKKTTW